MNHAHAFDLFRREETELNLLNGAQRRLGVGKVNVRHRGGRRRCSARGCWLRGRSCDRSCPRRKRNKDRTGARKHRFKSSSSRWHRYATRKSDDEKTVNPAAGRLWPLAAPCHEGARDPVFDRPRETSKRGVRIDDRVESVRINHSKRYIAMKRAIILGVGRWKSGVGAEMNEGEMA